jgi:hypothetical protein
MVRFDFHPRTGDRLGRNDVGTECPNLQAAEEEAVLAARFTTAETDGTDPPADPFAEALRPS